MSSSISESSIFKKLRDKLEFINILDNLNEDNKSFVSKLKREIYVFSNNDNKFTFIYFEFNDSVFSTLNLTAGDDLFKENGGLFHLKNIFIDELQFVKITVTDIVISNYNPKEIHVQISLI